MVIFYGRKWRAALTRHGINMLFDHLKVKIVVFACSIEFQEAVETSILDVFGVKKVDLTPQGLLQLENEVSVV